MPSCFHEHRLHLHRDLLTLLCFFPVYIGHGQLFILLHTVQFAVVSFYKELQCNHSASKIMFQTNKDIVISSQKKMIQKLFQYSFKRY